MIPQSPYLTTQEAADYLRLNYFTVQKKAKAGLIRSARSGKNYRFKTEWLDAYLVSEGTPEVEPQRPAKTHLRPVKATTPKPTSDGKYIKRNWA